MSHILIDASGSPIPLPFHTRDIDGDLCAITNFEMRGKDPMLYLKYEPDMYDNWYHVDVAGQGLAIVTEAEFMRRQQP